MAGEKVNGVVDERGKPEEWSKWLIPGGVEEYKNISSPEVQKVVKSLARRQDNLTPTEVLIKYYDDIERLEETLEDEKAKAQALEYMDRIGRRAFELTENGDWPISRTSLPDRQQERPPLRPLPLYIGAVFRGGNNERMVEDPEKVVVLDITNPAHRERFIFENIRAFDFLFKKGSAWKEAVDLWISDFEVANLGPNLEPKLPTEVSEDFERKLKAVMAITASARAFEDSNGITPAYLKIILGVSPDGKNPDIDKEDQWSTWLLHADPAKLNEVLDNPLVRRYYDRIMNDAGLVNEKNHEWQIMIDPYDSKGEKQIQIPSIVELNGEREFVVRNSRLIPYLEKSAEGGGVQKYIEKVLLEDDVRDGTNKESSAIRMTAARIAFDAFIDDKWTRWADKITDHGRVPIRLATRFDFGGDPLGMVLRPTAPARGIGNYTTKEDVILLDMVDAACRPENLFAELVSDPRYEVPAATRLLVPSLVTKASNIFRVSDGAFLLTGGGSAKNLAAWTQDTIRDLSTIVDEFNRVYGKMEVYDKDQIDPETRKPKKIVIGKHLLGDMIMKMLYAKSLATSAESASPSFLDLIKTSGDTESKTRPFMEVLYFLYGPKLDAKSGFIQNLTGPRTRFILRDNMFDAEKFYSATYDVLQTNDQTGKSAGIANYIRFGAAVARFLGDAAGSGGKKR